MLDTHCHLTFPDYEGRVGDVLDAAARAGVTGAITISTTTADCLDALALAESDPRLWCTAGVHPLYSDRTPHRWEHLTQVARSPRCVAWGEIGLDRHYPEPPESAQVPVLEHQLQLIADLRAAPPARRIDLPVVLHCREAFAELIPRLAASGLPPERFVFHCFTGGPADMERVLDFGAWASFTGVLTYRNAPEVREAARMLLETAPDRVMVETDAPFLSPEPKRGVRPNEPALVVHTARRLAEIAGASERDVFERLRTNAERFFGVTAPPPD